jgi:hypothetical protein
MRSFAQFVIVFVCGFLFFVNLGQPSPEWEPHWYKSVIAGLIAASTGLIDWKRKGGGNG